jgi:outer membrane protein assembly factor BamD
VKKSTGRNILLVLSAAMILAGCFRRNPVDTPLISDSQQPDKELFDRATNFLERNRFTEARLLLQTLINSYPESEYLAKAKLMIADSWYRQGSTSDLLQAEAEYRDFITFFPTMPEAGEAQMRVAMIHYRAMEKPDRDPNHARRAEQEFQRLLLTYPDGPFAPLAEQRLREVQEVLAHGIFEIGRFYFLNSADYAAQPRLKELVERYPNYSRADTALFLLGRSLERYRPAGTTDDPAEYYARIVRDYPLSEHAEDVKERLRTLDAAIPEPDPVAIARMTYEETHSVSQGLWGRMFGGFHRRPNVDAAQGRIGPPTMTPQGPAQAGALAAAPGEASAAPSSSGSSTAPAITMETVTSPGAGSGTPRP